MVNSDYFGLFFPKDQKESVLCQSQRKQYSSQNMDNRQDAVQHSGGYYGGRYYNGNSSSNDDWDDGEVVAVAIGAAAVGAAVGRATASQSSSSSTTTVYTAPPSATGGLPCTPNMSVFNGVSYYQCGTSWYTQAYGNTGVMYIPVPPPGH